jgi:hypothetical protein
MFSQAQTGPDTQSRTIPLVTPAPIYPDAPMTASEQMFYFGAPLAHVICYQEHRKLERRLGVRLQLAGSSGRSQQVGWAKRPALELS